MDIPAVLIRIVGVGTLIWTIQSTWKHFKLKQSREAKRAAELSTTESLLNNILLYLFYLFFYAFSIGMIVNNNF